jgi:hypothetical protein
MTSILKCAFIFLLFSLFSPLVFSQIYFASSNLPLVVINTNGQQIIDDPKIIADMGIIWNGAGKRNTLSDPKNNYNGKIGIEIRGSSSQMFPKKSYGVETKSNDLVTTDFPLLDMPAENDWILYAPYTDKTMIRDVLTYTLDASFGHWSPRCRFVELFLNGSYEGVYVLMEKIKRNKNRVDIAKLTLTDNAGEDLTGGYIIKIDKTTGSSGAGWYSNYSNVAGNTYYQFDYPKSDVITSSQRTYIQDYTRSMETALYQEKFTGAGSYHDFLNDSSFVDFMIINELAKNVDGYRLSSYLYKGKNDRMNCGPIWDFNLGYGNADYYNGWSPYGFQYNANLGTDYWQNPFWWNKLMVDATYVSNLKKRWTLLRKKELSNNRITFVIDSLTKVISEAKDRNYQRWTGVIGQYIWPNYYIGYSYASEVDWMKNWITDRLTYLDYQWPYNFTGTNDNLLTKFQSVYPNPFFDQLTIHLLPDINGAGWAEIYSMSGSLLLKSNVVIQDGKIQLEFSGRNTLSSGLYVLKISQNNRILLTEKVMKQ